jgi:hypothetical protein
MAVRKIEKRVDVDALIDQGAKVKEDFKKQEKEWVMVNLRVPKDMLRAVDAAVDRRVGISRTGWILEAMHEKIQNA